jgi:hypothetical protein
LIAIAARAREPVNYEWLRKFAAGKIDNPGVKTIEQLHAALRGLQ